MNKEEWLKAINCTKEQLIEWLNEMYEDEKINREIIKQYENIVKPSTTMKNGNEVVKVTPSFQYYKHNW